MRDLLERWQGELAVAGMAGPGALRPGDAAAVAALEQRVGVPLPPSYREFLEFCDGIPVTGAGIAGLRGPATVGWFRDLESEWFQIWREMDDDGSDEPNEDVGLMARALLVSQPGDQALLLDPEDVDPATGEWACYTFSNFAPGSRRVGTFQDGLGYVYRSFLGSTRVAPPTRDEDETAVDQIYQAMLSGDLQQRERLEKLVSTSWRAWLLAAQFDAFGAKPYGGQDLSTAVHHLWTGNLGRVSIDQALADPVLQHELVPMWVVRLVENGVGTAFELRRAPGIIADRIRALQQQIDDGTGPVADFAYSPTFAAQVELARARIGEGDLEAAWEIIVGALPSWQPMTQNHLAPLGLYYDKDLRRLLTPPPPTMPLGPDASAILARSPQLRQLLAPAHSPHLVRIAELSDRKQYSPRTIAVLETPYRTTQ
jgi:hypothetical protein